MLRSLKQRRSMTGRLLTAAETAWSRARRPRRGRLWLWARNPSMCSRVSWVRLRTSGRRPGTRRTRSGCRGAGRRCWSAAWRPRWSGSAAHQPAAAARAARADMLQQAAAARPQPGEPPCGRDRVLRPRPGHHRKLEQAAHRGDPPVHRGRRCPAPGAEPDHRLARRAYRALLPVQVVEQARRHHLGQPGIPPGQEPQEVQQV